MEITPQKIINLLKATKPSLAKLSSISPDSYQELPNILGEEAALQYFNFAKAMLEMSRMTDLAKSQYNRSEKEIFHYFEKLIQEAGLNEQEFRLLVLSYKAQISVEIEIWEIMLSRPWSTHIK